MYAVIKALHLILTLWGPWPYIYGFGNSSPNECFWICWSRFFQFFISFSISKFSICVVLVRTSIIIMIVNTFQAITDADATALFLL